MSFNKEEIIHGAQERNEAKYSVSGTVLQKQPKSGQSHDWYEKRRVNRREHSKGQQSRGR